MANSWFQFKRFKVNQDRCAMKISTDAVMLGALADLDGASGVLEIGAGTGVISLMLAQRFEKSEILAVEIEADAADQCRQNFESSPFSNRLSILHLPIQDLDGERKYPQIISNPPYFPDHLKPQDLARQRALHTDSLSFRDLAEAVSTRLEQQGDFWLILPPRQLLEFDLLAGEYGLTQWNKISLTDRPGKACHREIAAYSLVVKPLRQSSLLLKTEHGIPSQAYRNCLAEFFLDF